MCASEGSVLTVILMMSVVMSILAGALAHLVQMNSKNSYRDEKSLKALFLAEAGFAETVSILNADWDNRASVENYGTTSLSDGTYTTSYFEDSENERFQIISTGQVKGVSRTVRAEVQYIDNTEAFEFGVFANNDFHMTNYINVTADVHTNRDINLGGTSQLYGIASASGSVNLSSGAGATTVYEGVLEKIFPTFNFNVYYNLADPSDRYTGDTEFKDVVLAPANGVIYVDGGVYLDGSVQLTGCIVATGSIVSRADLTQYALPELPALMSRDGSITFYDDVDIEDGIVYSGAANVVIREDFIIRGSVIAFQDVTIAHAGTGVSQQESETIPVGLEVAEAQEGLRVLSYHE